MHSLGFEGSTVNGSTSLGGVTSPTFPHNRTAPVCGRSSKVLEINLLIPCRICDCQISESEGGGVSYFMLLKTPLNGLMNSVISTPSLIHCRISSPFS